MLSNGLERGFTEGVLKRIKDPRVGKDAGGYFIYTTSENIKVYIDSYYEFLEKTEKRALEELGNLNKKIAATSEDYEETLAFYRAKKIIIGQLLKNIYHYYTDSVSTTSLMTPWCFGTVVLEKVEIYRDKLSKGLVRDEDIPEYPFYVLQYIDEIYKKTLLDIFEFPEKAFSMRWQYTELLKRYSKVLSNVTNSLQNVLMMIKSYGR
ncbi:MAG: hypothetical protein B6D58_09955 [candidate division Zixibacteria bacterium 4484_95]|nr:MAG: hypothetical protein B6D58_09955 [candidate division Zixibacteria bacterium 4484_95]